MLIKPLQIPHTPGVYFFKKGDATLYVGKAGDLQKRLSSYWRKNAGTKVESLLHEADTVEWRELESAVDALIKEAEYIKNHIPKYNVLLRDDKSYFYVAITREEFPKIFISHNPYNQPLKASVIGPFTSGNSLRIVLRMLRKIFPYCTCFKPHKRPCLNAEIGRCLGYCCIITNQKSGVANHERDVQKEEDLLRNNFRSENLEFRDKIVEQTLRPIAIDKPKSFETILAEIMNLQQISYCAVGLEYRKNIRNIRAVLNGKKTRIIGQLKREMKHAAREQKFEDAAKIRNQIMSLENIFLHAATFEREKTFRVRRNWGAIEKTMQKILAISKPIARVEGYDISNISGTDAAGSMVVFINGKPAKSEYRTFRIKRVQGPNDVAMIQEVMRRRLGHTEWRYPDLMLIDGGKPQLHAATRELRIANYERKIHAAGLAKQEEELYLPGRKEPILLRTLPREVEFFFEHIRNESHRFAKKYHHKLREIKYREKKNLRGYTS